MNEEQLNQDIKKGELTEFLITYGWVILIIIIMFIVLWKIGAFDSP